MTNQYQTCKSCIFFLKKINLYRNLKKIEAGANYRLDRERCCFTRKPNLPIVPKECFYKQMNSTKPLLESSDALLLNHFFLSSIPKYWGKETAQQKAIYLQQIPQTISSVPAFHSCLLSGDLLNGRVLLPFFR